LAATIREVTPTTSKFNSFSVVSGFQAPAPGSLPHSVGRAPMADTAKAAVLTAVDSMASDMKATWDSQLNWAATCDALMDVIVEIGVDADPVHTAILLSAAAMARRQSLNGQANTIIISSTPYNAKVGVDVVPTPPGQDYGADFSILADAQSYANRLSVSTGWPIVDLADRDYVS
jgi:hypothetical protein